jgi:hypothetical protein
MGTSVKKCDIYENAVFVKGKRKRTDLRIGNSTINLLRYLCQLTPVLPDTSIRRPCGKSMFSKGVAISQRVSKGHSHIARLPLLGQDLFLYRLLVDFVFSQHPISGFGQMTRHRTDSHGMIFAMAGSFIQ